jgi:hypothetical protein
VNDGNSIDIDTPPVFVDRESSRYLEAYHQMVIEQLRPCANGTSMSMRG